MIPQLFRYFKQRLFHKPDLRLAMTILVRDEADIIEDNIRFHAAQGVHCFAVMDNNSSDGTRKILERLKSTFDLHIIDQPDNNYRQAEWMTELAFYARDVLKADLVISNDADEFWLPEQGTKLTDHLAHQDSVITVKRTNMALTEDCYQDNYHFTDATHAVVSPILYDSATQISQDAVSMLLVKINHKVIVNPYGLVKMRGGNHSAKHAWKHINQRQVTGIRVFHFPIRTYAQFEQNIINRQRLLAKTSAKMGDHYRRWVSLYAAGELEQEFAKFVLTKEELAVTDRLGITAYSPEIGASFAKLQQQQHSHTFI